MMIELETRKLEDVPIGGVFIGNDRDFFGASFTGFEPYVKVENSGWICVFGELGYPHYHYTGGAKCEVAYTGVILNG